MLPGRTDHLLNWFLQLLWATGGLTRQVFLGLILPEARPPVGQLLVATLVDWPERSPKKEKMQGKIMATWGYAAQLVSFFLPCI